MDGSSQSHSSEKGTAEFLSSPPGKSENALVHLIYASVAVQRFDSSQLIELLQQSRIRNAQRGITGMLLHTEGNFFQVLEGPREQVHNLYRKITQDTRHSQMTLIIDEPISKRTFECWSMGFVELSAKDLQQIEGCNDFFQSGACFARISSGRAKKLLMAFGAGRWRTRLSSSVAKVPVHA